MQHSEKQRFSILVTGALAYYRQDMSEFALNVWWEGCKPFAYEQVAKALTAHATDPDKGQFAPKVADIIRQLSGTHTDRAMLAWGKVHEAMSSVGAYTDVVFDDPAVHAVVDDMGGWPKICRTETKDLSYLQHRFCESYKAYIARPDIAYPRRLMGDRSPDSEYQKKGLPLPKPALVGNADIASAVFANGSASGKTAITYKAVEALGFLPIAKQE